MRKNTGGKVVSEYMGDCNLISDDFTDVTLAKS